jgi:RimJ/RimL family protein N-acetyltransferase
MVPIKGMVVHAMPSTLGQSTKIDEGPTSLHNEHMSQAPSADNGRPSPWRPPNPLPVAYHTDRLVLRFFTPDDAASMLGALDTDRGSFLPWLPWVETDNRTIAECVYSIESFRRKRESTSAVPDDFVIGIFDRVHGEVIGGTGFHRIGFDPLEAEIGYWVRPDRRGEGLCTEAVAAMLSWGFTAQTASGPAGWGFRRIHIRCAASNTASRRVPEKLGLRLEATFSAARWVPGRGWDDSLAFGVLSHERDNAAHLPTPRGE